MTNDNTDPDDGIGGLALGGPPVPAGRHRAAVAAGGVRTDFKSGAHDLVTTADKAAEAAIIEVIRAARPDDAILGEEGGAHRDVGSRWLVDPLDGTANFVYGRADHAVSVGVETDGVITAGAIIRVSDGRWAAASWGPPAPAATQPGRTTGRQRSCSAQREPGGPRRAGAGLLRPALRPRRPAAGVRHHRGACIPQIRGVRIAGSAACDFLALAHGECDAFVGCGLAEWDTAAGQAIVAASGGAILQIPGPGFDILIAAAPPLARELADSSPSLRPAFDWSRTRRRRGRQSIQQESTEQPATKEPGIQCTPSRSPSAPA